MKLFWSYPKVFQFFITFKKDEAQSQMLRVVSSQLYKSQLNILVLEFMFCLRVILPTYCFIFLFRDHDGSSLLHIFIFRKALIWQFISQQMLEISIMLMLIGRNR